MEPYNQAFGPGSKVLGLVTGALIKTGQVIATKAKQWQEHHESDWKDCAVMPVSKQCERRSVLE